MTRAYLQPKDALVLSTVTLLFIYFGVVLWTNYAIIIPYWTPLFWAAALSVPLHGLKTRLLPTLYNVLENDIMDIVASAIGTVTISIIQFFLGSYIASAIQTVFHSYCYIVYMICDGRPRGLNKEQVKRSSGENNSVKEKGNTWEQEGIPNVYYKRTPANDIEESRLDRVDPDDYELRPSYQILVDQEPDRYMRPVNGPSYTNLLRAALIYTVLQFTTPMELWELIKLKWSEIQFGTTTQLTCLIMTVIVHMQFVCMKQLVPIIERVFYPNLSLEERQERSLLNTIPKMVRKTLQESLNSVLATIIVLSTLSILGILSTILSIGVVHDVQGLLVQTHQRVAIIKEGQLRHGFHDMGYESVAKNSLTKQLDGALEQAYEAAINRFDPILKEAFPDLAWGANDWAYNVANVVVNPDQDYHYYYIPRHKQKQHQMETQQEEQQHQQEQHQSAPVDSCNAEAKQEINLNGLIRDTNQSPLNDNVVSTSLSAAKDSNVEKEDKKKADEGFQTNSEETKEGKEDEAEVVRETPELWIIPSLDSLGFSGSDADVSITGLLHSNQRKKAINISQVKSLLTIVSGFRGFDTENMLWGFNAFNDLLFRCILFLLGLLTLTGLKVSPLQRIGWMIDQAFVSQVPNFDSTRLPSSASPGRAIAKSLEFAISGTFVAMLKLSIYHTLFTLIWTRSLANQVFPLIAVGAASSDFVAVKYAWLTSLFGIILVLFPIAPNWLVALPGGIVHFYIYGQRPIEAIAMVLGHVVMSSLVDGAVWDSHVVRTARPSVSTAFWLGLWTFLGGMKWGPKGLLLGPVFFAAIPTIWSAILELRGKPGPHSITDYDHKASMFPNASDEIEEETWPRNNKQRCRDRRGDQETDEEVEYHIRQRTSGTGKNRNRSTRRANGNRH
ncbi:hypothetical protein BCR41DRAFT_383151 [Lobosporangium transversale]|uniref:Uncharacterized protein n=1 Tax=Lobosporangium transversale TaxID=64571 RepID=A0A1Y2H179_9FUNG|nr:hypothetical protein BCR41DRAFT_383151 [Lobosporangium transversale]ORZ28309.1 hypothetical protein BCR41DRAFT_383151 [Lobosporangium transversale]|eukprot:XP_021885994.1 hypothetical protein BCR41DRAFT_383151 [Lobosporangium transversale]